MALATVAAMTAIGVLTWKLASPNAIAPAADEVPPTTSTVTIRGSVTLKYDDLDIEGYTCSGQGGYGDIRGDVDVIVLDPDGGRLALSKLEHGRLLAPSVCKFLFRVDGVPAGLQFYSLEIGDREPYNFPTSDLSKRESIDLRLGVG